MKTEIKNHIIGLIKFVALFAAVFIIVFSIINWPAVSKNAQYFWNKIFHSEEQNDQNGTLPKISSKKETLPSAKSQNLENNHIYIKKLNLNVPIVWDVPEKDFISSLQKGVAHYKGTSKPNTEAGNIFIAGHSSSYWWQRGDYSAIFSVIGNLEAGDKISVTYQNKVYRYQVTDKFIVKPNQVDVMQYTKKPTLTLMTCTPIGTAVNRLIIRAEFISS